MNPTSDDMSCGYVAKGIVGYLHSDDPEMETILSGPLQPLPPETLAEVKQLGVTTEREYAAMKIAVGMGFYLKRQLRPQNEVELGTQEFEDTVKRALENGQRSADLFDYEAGAYRLRDDFLPQAQQWVVQEVYGRLPAGFNLLQVADVGDTPGGNLRLRLNDIMPK